MSLTPILVSDLNVEVEPSNSDVYNLAGPLLCTQGWETCLRPQVTPTALKPTQPGELGPRNRAGALAEGRTHVFSRYNLHNVSQLSRKPPWLMLWGDSPQCRKMCVVKAGRRALAEIKNLQLEGRGVISPAMCWTPQGPPSHGTEGLDSLNPWTPQE